MEDDHRMDIDSNDDDVQNENENVNNKNSEKRKAVPPSPIQRKLVRNSKEMESGNKKKKKKKRRLSATRDAISDLMMTDPVSSSDQMESNDDNKDGKNGKDGNNTKSESVNKENQENQSKEPQMVSRRRRKRHSLSSNAIKKSIKNPTKKLFESLLHGTESGANGQRERSPFDVAKPSNVKRTFNRRKGRRSRSKSIASSSSLQSSLQSSPSTKSSSSSGRRTGNKVKSGSTTESITTTPPPNVCPLLTQLIEDRAHLSQIAVIGHFCLCKVALRANVKQQSMLRKLDSLLALISRAEMMLNNDERARLQQIESAHSKELSVGPDGDSLWSDDWKSIYKKGGRRSKGKKKGNKQTATKKKGKRRPNVVKRRVAPNGKKRRKRVRFCCYDMSTVNTPEYGELDSVKHCQSVCRLLVQSAKIGHKLFAIKSDNSWTRKTILMLIEELRQYIEGMDSVNGGQSEQHSLRYNVARYLLQQIEDSYHHRMEYPWADRVQQHLSSLIRFNLKTIFNATEFVEKSKTVTVPKWYGQIGTFSVINDDEAIIDPNGEIPEDAEFIPYHAAEITLNLEALEAMQLMMASTDPGTTTPSAEAVMEDLGILDNPKVFFHEMHQVLENVNPSIIGGSETTKSKRGRKSEFEKYLDSKWKELKQCLHDVQSSNCKQLFFYLPLLDFASFLRSMKVDC